MHHPALAHGGGGLLHPQGPGPLVQAHPGRAHGDGPGGHQDDLMPPAAEIRQHPDQTLHAPQVQAAGAVGQGGGAHLDHHPPFLFVHKKTASRPSGLIFPSIARLGKKEKPGDAGAPRRAFHHGSTPGRARLSAPLPEPWEKGGHMNPPRRAEASQGARPNAEIRRTPRPPDVFYAFLSAFASRRFRYERKRRE